MGKEQGWIAGYVCRIRPVAAIAECDGASDKNGTACADDQVLARAIAVLEHFAQNIAVYGHVAFAPDEQVVFEQERLVLGQLKCGDAKLAAVRQSRHFGAAALYISGVFLKIAQCIHLSQHALWQRDLAILDALVGDVEVVGKAFLCVSAAEKAECEQEQINLFHVEKK